MFRIFDLAMALLERILGIVLVKSGDSLYE